MSKARSDYLSAGYKITKNYHQEPFRPFGSISCPNAYQAECQPEAGIVRRAYQGTVAEWQYAAGGCYLCCGESGV